MWAGVRGLGDVGGSERAGGGLGDVAGGWEGWGRAG